MKRIIKVLVIVVFAALVIIQFFRIDKNNPPIAEEDTLERSVAVPDEVEGILKASCNDCHSNRTVYPWYSNVAPVSWLLKNDIDEGRQKLNFSIFNTYDPKKKARRLEQICELVESKEMPLPSYLWMHRDAVLTPEQSRALCDWSRIESEKISIENGRLSGE